MKILDALAAFVFWVYFGALITVALTPFWPEPLWWLANAIQIVPLWPLLVPPVCFLLFALLRKKMSDALLQMGIILFVLVWVMGWRPLPRPTERISAEDFSVRIVSLNVGGAHLDAAVLKDWLDSVGPDIVVLQETSDEELDVFRKVLPAEWNFYPQGLILGSRFPIVSTKAKSRQLVGGWGEIARRYQLQTPVGVINVLNVHFETPRKGLETWTQKNPKIFKDAMTQVTNLQDSEIQIIEKWIASQRNLIMAGDFNMRSENPLFRRSWGRLADAFSKAGQGFGYSKLTHWHGVRIDHVLAGSDWRVTRFTLGPDVGSDHRPIFAELVFQGQTGREADLDVQADAQGQELPIDRMDVSSSLKTEGEEDYSGEHILTIRGNVSAETNQTSLNWKAWNIDQFDQVSFAYKAWPGTKAAIRVRTQFGDWICIARTPDTPCDGTLSPKAFELIADNSQWRFERVDIKEMVRSALKSVKYLEEWQWQVFPGGDNVVWVKNFLVSGYGILNNQ